MVGQHPRDGGREFLGESDVEEFVGAMGVGMGTQHAGDDELRAGKPRPQHRHEGDRAAFALIGDRLAPGGVAGGVQRFFQPGRQGGRIPAIVALRIVEGDAGADV